MYHLIWGRQPTAPPGYDTQVIPNKQNHVRIAANFDGEVELLVAVGDVLFAGQGVVEIESDDAIERLCAKQRSRVIELLVDQDAEVSKYDALVVIELLPDED